MDIMKVGESLGLGSIGLWDNDRVVKIEDRGEVTCKVYDRAVCSSIKITYKRWNVLGDTIAFLNSNLTINAGSRGQGFKSEGDKGSWGYIATYGKQSANNDNLGLVILFSPENFRSFHEG